MTSEQTSFPEQNINKLILAKCQNEKGMPLVACISFNYKMKTVILNIFFLSYLLEDFREM